MFCISEVEKYLVIFSLTSFISPKLLSKLDTPSQHNYFCLFFVCFLFWRCTYIQDSWDAEWSSACCIAQICKNQTWWYELRGCRRRRGEGELRKEWEGSGKWEGSLRWIINIFTEELITEAGEFKKLYRDMEELGKGYVSLSAFPSISPGSLCLPSAPFFHSSPLLFLASYLPLLHVLTKYTVVLEQCFMLGQQKTRKR